MNKKPYSIQRTLWFSYTVILLSFLCLCLAFFLYSMHTLKKQYTASGTHYLQMYSGNISNAVSKVSSTLMQYELNGIFPLMRVPDSTERYYNKQDLVNSLSTDMLFLDLCDGLFLYDYRSEEYVYAFDSQSRDTYLTRLQFPAVAMDIIQSAGNSTGSGWFIRDLDDHSYVIYLQYADGICCGSWLNTETVLHGMPEALQGNRMVCQVTDKSGNLLAGSATASGSPRFHLPLFSPIVLQADVNSIPLRLQVFCPASYFLSGISPVLFLLLISTLLAFITIPLHNRLIRQTVRIPLDSVTFSIRSYEADQSDYVPSDEYMPDEVIRINHALYRMYHEIHSLRISKYENELKLKDVHLRYLQHQVKPHFIINVLNEISILAQLGQTERITEAITYLSHYTRFLLNTSIRMVPLEYEVQQLENYLALQELRYPEQFSVHIDIPHELDSCQIPILTLQTILENAFKYAIRPDRILKITITAAEMVKEEGGETFVNLTVSDNGPGFPADYLQHFADADRYLSDGSHIGLNNICSRLQLEYPVGAGMQVHNDEVSGGAVVTLQFPFVPAEQP